MLNVEGRMLFGNRLHRDSLVGMHRYCQKAFPAYQHIPGRTPHPTRHPDGHSYGVDLEIPVFDPAAFQEHTEYLYGIDLHNYGYCGNVTKP